VTTHLQDWEPDATGSPRRACVNSFSHGGTNVILVVEEAPEQEPALPASARIWHLLPLSARTPTALEAATDRLAAWLEHHPDLSLADVAFTLQTGRRTFEHRRFVLARSLEEAREALRERRGSTGVAERRSPSVPLEMTDSAEGMEAIGSLWLTGADIDWQALHAGETRRRVALPTYPFERRRFWVSPPAAATEQGTPETADESAAVTV
jgi:acyl transferase domain-containing protein